MSVRAPGTTDVVRIATELGYAGVAADPDAWAAAAAGMLGVYDALDAFAAATGEERRSPARGPVRHRVPTPEEDPHHAWVLRARIAGVPGGPLDGVRLAVKDSIMVAGLPMANGTDILAGHVPTEDATVVSRALRAGATVVGKTTNEYLCMSGGSHTSAGGPVHNPHRRGHSAGGSSSGSAVALVTGNADMALGTDQAGSIRMPASWCGVVGLKPTYGLVPYTGIAPLDGALDHVGPMTRTVADNARLLAVLAGPDGIDPRQGASTTSQGAAHTAADTTDTTSDLAGLRVGVLREGFGGPRAEAEVDRTVRAAADGLAAAGAEVTEVSVPLHAFGPALWTAVAVDGLAETLLRHQGFAAGRWDRYPLPLMERMFAARRDVEGRPATVKLFTLVGRWVDEQQGRLGYARALNAARTLRAAYDDALTRCDVLVMPTTPQTARPLPGPDATLTELLDASSEMSANTTPFNLTGHPALSVPCGRVDGLPVGMQLVGRAHAEATLYRVGLAVEAG